MEIYNFQCCIIYLCFYIFKGILFLTKMGHGVPTNKHETLERFFLHGNVGDVGFTLRKIISKIVFFQSWFSGYSNICFEHEDVRTGNGSSSLEFWEVLQLNCLWVSCFVPSRIGLGFFPKIWPAGGWKNVLIEKKKKFMLLPKEQPLLLDTFTDIFQTSALSDFSLYPCSIKEVFNQSYHCYYVFYHYKLTNAVFPG